MARTAQPIRTVRVRRSRRRRAPVRPRATGLLAAAVIGGAVASLGVVVGSAPGPALTPAALVSAAPAAPGQPAPRPGMAYPGRPPAPAPLPSPEEDAALVAQPQAVAFLAAMRAAKVPTSRNGLAEVLAARAVCNELAKGTTETQLADRLPSRLPTITRKQAVTLVNLAQKHYC